MKVEGHIFIITGGASGLCVELNLCRLERVMTVLIRGRATAEDFANQHGLVAVLFV